MRNEMIGAIVRRAIEHPEFRRRLMDEPQEALKAHGFALEDAEMRELDSIRGSVGSADDAEQKLISIAEKYGLHT
jgi:hypothetical protein